MARRLVIDGNVLYVDGRNVLLNGKPLPNLPRPAKSITQIDGKVFIDGYEYRRGKWRRTLKALWYLFI